MRKQELHPRTAVINRSQKNRAKKARSEALLWLAANFPHSFDNSLRIRPLKIGIMNDILQYADKAAEAGISKAKLREAVVLFTRRLDYLACLKSREMRVDLNGNEVSSVTEEEAQNAAAKIKKRVEKSLKNARKTVLSKPMSSVSHSNYQSKSSIQMSTEDNLPIYPPRAPIQTPSLQPVKTAAIVVKKATKQFDPTAVARLKEKLGLSREEK